MSDGEKTEYIILSYRDMQKGIDTKAIHAGAEGHYWLNLGEHESDMYVSENDEMSVQYNRNKWKIIEQRVTRIVRLESTSLARRRKHTLLSGSIRSNLDTSTCRCTVPV